MAPGTGCRRGDGLVDRDLERRIRERAHRLWEEEGQPEGRGHEHWREAERQIMIESGMGEPAGAQPHLPPDDRPEPQPDPPADPFRNPEPNDPGRDLQYPASTGPQEVPSQPTPQPEVPSPAPSPEVPPPMPTPPGGPAGSRRTAARRTSPGRRDAGSRA